MFKSRPTVAEIDLAALRHNYAALSAAAGSGVAVIPVVKAEAYGHGAGPVAVELAAVGVPAFAVATVREAAALKDQGIEEDVLVLGVFYEDDLPIILAGKVVPTLWDYESARRLARLARERRTKLPVQIKIDTGMHRAGIPPAEASEFIDFVLHQPEFELRGLLSHLAVADGESSWERRYTGRQAEAFAAQTRLLPSEVAVDCHLANSAGIIHYDFAVCNQARAGIALYGSYPDAAARSLIDLKPVMRVKSGIVLLKKLRPGDSLSYGCTYTARENITVALLPVGYADGLSRAFSSCGEVLIRGRRAPIIGRVCMDWTMVEVSEIEDVAVGDEVVLLGRQGDQEISAEAMAARIGTISYEIFCAWSSRVPRLYINSALTGRE